MKRITRIAALAVLTISLAALMQPANAACSNARQFATAYGMYIYTPGCGTYGNVLCDDGTGYTSTMSLSASGTFWGIGDGDFSPTVGLGIDNGTLPFIGGWRSGGGGYPATFSGTWAVSSVDGCIDFTLDPARCMAVLLQDINPDTGNTAIAIATDAPDAGNNYLFATAGPITLQDTGTMFTYNATNDGAGNITVNATVGATLDAAQYLDPDCPLPYTVAAGAGGGTPLALKLCDVEVPQGDPAPSNFAAWNCGEPGVLNTTVSCSATDAGAPTKWVAGAFDFDSNAGGVLSGEAFRIECDSNLANPEEIIERKVPRNREKPRTRSRGR